LLPFFSSWIEKLIPKDEKTHPYFRVIINSLLWVVPSSFIKQQYYPTLNLPHECFLASNSTSELPGLFNQGFLAVFDRSRSKTARNLENGDINDQG
jgi:hypothetical protein